MVRCLGRLVMQRLHLSSCFCCLLCCEIALWRSLSYSPEVRGSQMQADARTHVFLLAVRDQLVFALRHAHVQVRIVELLVRGQHLLTADWTSRIDRGNNRTLNLVL